MLNAESYERLVAAVEARVRADGVERTAKALQISKETVVRLVARLGVRRGTLALVRERLDRLGRGEP